LKTPVFVGVDVAGEKKTWVSALTAAEGGLELSSEAQPMGLESIVHFCEGNEVVSIAIDAPLTAALTDKHGRRTSDDELKDLLPRNSNWVMSANSMMAVPVRGQLLADALAPIVGTIIETHPRACLYFFAGQKNAVESVANYKKSDREGRRHTQTLWNMWIDHFKINSKQQADSDDALDSLVCATVAYLYHGKPTALRKLVHKAIKLYGRGPFVVLDPDVYSA
jgi:predicted nuclease with RNAse H fold